MLQAVLEILVVVLRIPLLVRLLNAAAGWSVIMCDGETDHRTVGHVERTLHETLAKRASAHHLATVVVLQRSRDNLGSRCRKLIYKHHHLSVEQLARPVRLVIHARRAQSAGINDEVVLRQELIGNLHCRLQIASAILLKVEQKVLHALLLQLVHSRHELVVCRGTETTDTDISHARTYHIRGVEAFHRNLVALHVEHQRILHLATHNGELHRSALRSAQAHHYLVAWHLHTGNSRVVHRHDAVASHDAGFLRRSLGDGLNHDERVFNHIELHSDTVEIALQRLVHLLRLLGVGI